MKLVGIETNNGLFKWNNKRGGESHVASKLDRFIISEDLMLIDKEIIANVLPFGGSDHWPIKTDIQGIGTPGIDFSDLRIFGFHTQSSSTILKNGGQKIYRFKELECSFYIKD